ncbi:Major facilitator superfamily domain, general substrate transporter [Ophiocordyceps sinensis CO18]|uniref:Major facilitator superfamily domain, general substrate transporter n=1 Tax=Ophiocordyceps sinensis (strain Co18 / CGMCC 3.14243) TaxID=911162 RepID=T5AQZ9_OPHSC|nr:Major facilitator superfamily domain, general substrate transporter [Ophiocordyceps sinensis CO18]
MALQRSRDELSGTTPSDRSRQHSDDEEAGRVGGREDSIGSVSGTEAAPADIEAYRSASHVSGPDTVHHHDDVSHPAAPGKEAPWEGRPAADDDDDDDVYHRLSPGRKRILVAVCSFCALLSPQSSTSVLAATPEVAAEYSTSVAVINASNVATAFEGTAFILLGAACIGYICIKSDTYRPTERGTAIGCFLSGTLVGPAFGPFLGGIMVTWASWRSIFWRWRRWAADAAAEDGGGAGHGEPRAAATAVAAIVWNMCSLLTPIRYVLNPQPWAGGGRTGRRGRGVVMPASILVYEWAVDRRVGGIPVPAVALFASTAGVMATIQWGEAWRQKRGAAEGSG